jgi:prepilin-type N-terminal cleavage/methylation domain-containing protein
MTRGRCAGFSLVELLIATGITAIVLAMASTMAVAELAAWRRESARVDLQQRARVAADALGRALLEAGVGPASGDGLGPLVQNVPPVLPRRAGARTPDAPDVFRREAFTVLRWRPDADAARLLTPAASAAAALEVAPSAACGTASCGFAAGDLVMLRDASAAYDIFAVTGAAGPVLSVRPLGAGTGSTYAAGTAAVRVTLSTFWHDRGTRALREYDGDTSDLPLLDDVVGMEVEYFGDTRPPVGSRPGGVANCLYEADGTYRAAWLPALGPVPALVALDAGLLTDGPWCGGGANAFDADLLRIRRVRVVLRLQAADPAVRGADPRHFALAGTARQSAVVVPDRHVTLDVALRNLRQGW